MSSRFVSLRLMLDSELFQWWKVVQHQTCLNTKMNISKLTNIKQIRTSMIRSELSWFLFRKIKKRKLLSFEGCSFPILKELKK